MNFLKGFLGGVIFTVLMIILVPLFSEGTPPTEVFSRLTSSNYKILTLVQIVFIVGCVFGLFVQIISWASRRNKERAETDKLMREYFEKKLREEQKDE